MAFRVLAPLVHLAGFTAPHFYKDRVIPHIPDPVQREHLLRLGMVEEVPDPLPPGVATDDTAPIPAVHSDPPVTTPQAPESAPLAPAPALERPAATASKDTWVAYVVATGAAKSAEEAAALTKDQLIQMAG